MTPASTELAVPQGTTLATSNAPRLGLPVPGEQRLLAGWMKPAHLAMYPAGALNPGAQFERQRRYSGAREAAGRLQPVNLTPTGILPLDGPDEAVWLGELERAPAFVQHYGHIPHRFGLVPIEKLTIFQPTLQSYEKPVPSTKADILKWCLPHEFRTEVTARMDGNRLFFLVDGPNTSLAPPAFSPQVGGFVLSVVGNANWVQVLKVGEDRFVLKNGVHRVAALAAAGHTHVPAIISDVPDLTSAVPVTNAGHRPWFTPEELAGFRRPPRVLDFFDESVTLAAAHENMRRVIEVRLDVQQFQLPVAAISA